MKKLVLFYFLAVCSVLTAQTFELDQIEQLFRPRLRADVKCLLPTAFADTSGKFSQNEVNTVFTFPLRTQFKLEVRPDLSSLKIKDILRNSLRLKASQTLAMLRFNARQASFGKDSVPAKNFVNVTGGILGLHLTKKFRVLFYSVNATLAEEDKTLSRPGFRSSALLGQMHIRGIRRNFFYGIAATYSDGLFLPAAFFGGSEPIGEHLVFNYILPVQVNVQYKDQRQLITAGVSGDGSRTGIDYINQRINLNYTGASGFFSYRYKLSNTLVARAEAGYVFWHRLNYTKGENYRNNFQLQPGIYFQVGCNVLFGNTLWEKIGSELFKN